MSIRSKASIQAAIVVTQSDSFRNRGEMGALVFDVAQLGELLSP
jgi:hypothetical protein